MMTPDDFRKLHVLLIEDEDFMRRLISRMLREIGVTRISIANDGDVGFTMLENHAGDVDIVLCDLEMPKVDGLQFISMVRANKLEGASSTPIIVLTGHAEDEVVRGAASLGIQGYLVKPVSKSLLVSRIVHAMENAKKKA